jgi:hypothetical protein
MRHMKKRSNNLREAYLDGEFLYRHYYEMGDGRSYKRLQKYMEGEGIETTTMGIWKAVWRWASLKENRNKAWEIYQAHSNEMSYNEWVMDMVEHKIPKAWQYNTQAKHNKFLKENGWA